MTDTLALADALASAGVACRAVEPGFPPRPTEWPAPGLIAEPSTSAQVADVLRLAGEAGAAVIPVGLGTRLHLGNRPRAADLFLSTARLDRVIEHEPANLTAIVEAGMPLRDLQARLAQHGQFLPLGDLAGTIGGVVATNASGPLRLGYGTARDLLIGARIATADGKLARTGGKVVKNVAGYDLGKLYVGSLGTLGVLVELAFKLAPIPESRSTHLSAHADPAAALAMARVLPRLQPLAADLLSPEVAGALGLGSDWTLAVLVGGVAPAVRRQLADLEKLTLGVGGRALGELNPAEGDNLWRRVSALGEGSALSVKASVPIAAAPAAVDALARVVSAGRPLIWAPACSGIVYASWADDQLGEDLASVAGDLARARREIVALGGALVVESAPLEVKEVCDVWGDVGGALGAMRALKSQFDPRGTLNPGRFVGGI